MSGFLNRIIGDVRDVQPIVNRRDFVKASGGATAAVLAAFGARRAGAVSLPFSPDYGPLAPVADEATGLPLLSLPAGFRYISFGWTGQRQSDGTNTPTDHDGMAVVAARGNTVALVRNYEQSEGEGNPASPANGRGVYNPAQNGGTGNLLFDVVQGRWLSSWNSLGGTIRNCAGGLTPWGTWLSCEETFHAFGAGPQGFNHGYVFEVPGFGISDGRPITEMGRFSHEAACVDPSTGWVYETEDAGDSAVYRFIPDGAWGDLKSGGTLQAMVLDGTRRVDTADGGFPVGTTWSVSWQDVPDPDAMAERCFDQADQAANFERGEGIWFDDGKVYVVSTSGGAASLGQIFEYDPRRETMTLIYEGTDASVLDGPDNITTTPRGALLLCEDGSSNPKRLVGLTRAGDAFTFCENQIVLDPGDIDVIDAVYPGTREFFADSPVGDFRSREWAGACFAGRWLFANVQSPGVTFAITGPWDDGAL